MTDYSHIAVPIPSKAGLRADGRKQNRKRMLKSGLIAYSGRQVTLDCVVRDLSDTGARLKICGSVEPPATFELIIGLDGLEAECEVKWRRDGEVGVCFNAPPRQVTPTKHQSLTLSGTQSRKSLLRKPLDKA